MLSRFLGNVVLGLTIFTFSALFAHIHVGFFQSRVHGPAVLKWGYIASITGPESLVKEVKNSLDYLNKLGNNEVVVYEPSAGIKIPIEIQVKKFDMPWEKGNAGLTWMMPTKCLITIDEDEQDNSEFIETVIHEYLHCLGYEHVKDSNDVMYESTTPYFTFDSIKRYAQEIRKRKHE